MKRSDYNQLLTEARIYTSAKLREEAISETKDDCIYTRAVGEGENAITEYYKVDKGDLSADEIKIALMVQQGNDLKSIKSMVKFFMVLAIISLAATAYSCFQIYKFVGYFM